MVNSKKMLYFIFAIVSLVLLEILIANHMDNKVMVRGTNKKEEKVIKLETFSDEDTGIVLKYELSDEILKDDKLLVRDKKVTKKLKKEGIIEYFSVSLYDKDEIKKRIKNSKLTLYFPIDEHLEKYKNIKVVRLNSKENITDEVFEYMIRGNYIVFDITMSSKYAITGEKK